VQKRKKLADKHGWNTFENYQNIHSQRLLDNPFVDTSKGLPAFAFLQEGSELFVTLIGNILKEFNLPEKPFQP
jgi:hypothetical protein